MTNQLAFDFPQVSWTKPPGFDGDAPAARDSASPTPLSGSGGVGRSRSGRSASGTPIATVLEVVEEEVTGQDESFAAGGGDPTEPRAATPSSARSCKGTEEADAEDERPPSPAGPTPQPSRCRTPDEIPFDERPFDEVADGENLNAPSDSPRRARFTSGIRSPAVMNSLALDAVERVDSFSDAAPPEPLYGVKSFKSLRSIDFHGARTFGTATTETTRKVANTGGGGGMWTSEHGTAENDSSFMSDQGGDVVHARLVSAVNESKRRLRSNDAKRAEDLGDGSTDGRSRPSSARPAGRRGDEDSWADDDDGVSALSGIGNESIEGRRRREERRKEKSRSGGRAGTSRPSPPRGAPGGWTQEELDDFISRNDWGSVAKYINEMRAAGNTGAVADDRDRSRPPAGRDENASTSSPGGESEDLWQSVSSRESDRGGRRDGPSQREVLL